jgi:hypothetical protein
MISRISKITPFLQPAHKQPTKAVAETGVVNPTAIFLNATDLYHAAGTLFLSGPHF